MTQPLQSCPRLILAAGLLPAALAAPSQAPALAPNEEPLFREHVRELVAEGRMEYAQGLLVRFQRIFAPQALPEELRSSQPWPARSATLLLREFQQARPMLPEGIVEKIDGYLHGNASASPLAFETEHFRLLYELSGPEAVDPTDSSPANGVPDFIERVASYAELSWARLVEENGFRAPDLTEGNYSISFREMNAYGYTLPSGGRTEMVLHRDFEGFPQNRDPDGSRWGAAKVATAHEFQHAVQFATSGWTEGGWLEADATWAEDFVFDATDDYLRYLPYGSPVSHPGSWRSGGVSYEDCLWEHLLAERWGPGILVSFFERRRARPDEPVTASFDAALRGAGARLEEATATLGLWSYFCGANAAERPVGFEEADSYPTPSLAAHLPEPRTAWSSRLSGMGTHLILIGGPDRKGEPWLSFSGPRQSPFAVHLVAVGSPGGPQVTRVPVSSSGTAAFGALLSWGEIRWLIAAVTNSGASLASSDYSLSVTDLQAVGSPKTGAGESFSLEPNRPNPFRSRTAIVFSLSEEARVNLSIYDLGGRLVKRILEGERLGRGRHERTWDGIDASGRPAAPGVYYYRLEAGQHVAARKMLLLR